MKNYSLYGEILSRPTRTDIICPLIKPTTLKIKSKVFLITMDIPISWCLEKHLQSKTLTDDESLTVYIIVRDLNFRKSHKNRDGLLTVSPRSDHQREFDEAYLGFEIYGSVALDILTCECWLRENARKVLYVLRIMPVKMKI